MDMEDLVGILAISLCVLLGFFFVGTIGLSIVYGFTIGYEWNKIESFFWLSDSSSSPEMKVYYLNQFIDELNNSGIAGYNSALLLPTPRGKADNVINQVISLRDRVSGLINRTSADLSYANEWKQINDVEYCWIQLRNLECSYAIKNGWGFACLFEPNYRSICYEGE